MRVFVSGQINDIENVRAVQDAFIAAGHTITHDWTRNETGGKLLGGRAAKFANPDEAGRRAMKDTQGVIDSDIYVICTDNKKVGKGMYAELGAALALTMTTGSPRIYLLGSKEHASIFYFHPAIITKSSAREIIEELAVHN